MVTELAILTVAEVDCLADCEQRIERGLKTFVEVGTALATIRDNRLYRAEHGTFEDYCQARWGFTRQRAHQITSAAEIASSMFDAGLPAPDNARQAAELARVPEPERADIWRETVERTDGKPTAAAIRETYERTQTPAITPEPEPAGTDVAAGSGHDHLSATGEADARLDAAGPTAASEAPIVAAVGAGDNSPTGPAPAPSAEHPRTPDRSGPDPLDDPEQVEAAHRQRTSESVAGALVSLLFALDPDPIRWLEKWQPTAYRNRDLPRVRDAFTTTGLRAIAKHLDTLADHLDHTGGSL